MVKNIYIIFVEWICVHFTFTHACISIPLSSIPRPPSLLIEPKRVGRLHLRSEPRRGAGHGPPRCVVGNPLRQEPRHLHLAQEPHPSVVLQVGTQRKGDK